MDQLTSRRTKMPPTMTFTPSRKPIVQGGVVKHDGDGRFLASLIEKEVKQTRDNTALLNGLLGDLRAAEATLAKLLETNKQIICILPSIAVPKKEAGATPRDESEASADKPSTPCTLEDDIKKLRTRISSLLSTPVDIHNPPVFKRALERLTRTFEQTNQFIQESMLCIHNKETAIAIAAADELLHGKISGAISLCTDYKSKKDALSFPSTVFFKAAPTRLGAIEFIESIAKLLQDELSAQRENLVKLAQHLAEVQNTPAFAESIEKFKTATKELTDLSQTAGLIIEGVYLYVMNDIQEDYKKGWMLKDPERSELYKLLSASIKSNTDEECLKRLKALEGFMQSHPQREKVLYGAQKHSDILAGTAALIETCTHHNRDTQAMAAP